MRKEIVTLVSDLSDEEASETVTFGLDGATYEIDLTRAEVAELRASLEPYVAGGRRVRGRRRASRTTVVSAPASKAERDAIRAWANEHGHAVSNRARIPAEVVEAYHRAH